MALDIVINLLYKVSFPGSLCITSMSLFKLIITVFKLSIPNLSTSYFRLPKPVFLANCYALAWFTFFKSAF